MSQAPRSRLSSSASSSRPFLHSHSCPRLASPVLVPRSSCLSILSPSVQSTAPLDLQTIREVCPPSFPRRDPSSSISPFPYPPDHLTYPIRQVRSPATRVPLCQTHLLDSRPRRSYTSLFPRFRLTITVRASGPHVLIPIKRTQPSFLGPSYSLGLSFRSTPLSVPCGLNVPLAPLFSLAYA